MKRMRRLRVNPAMRRLVRETQVTADDLVYPMFVEEGTNIKEPVESMPGIFRYSMDRLDEELDRVLASRIPAVLLFGIPKHKDEVGSEAYNDAGVVQEAIRAIKAKAPDLLVIADVCLCEYTSHGHCGLVCDHHILNDETLELLAKMAVSVAKAGADIIAPSDMMDGRIGVIRHALDEHGFTDRAIMAYSAKFSSAYYGPFREAAGSAPSFGDRKTYQMDYANGQEALRECANDIEEEADFIMVKPGLAYLDVVKEVAMNFNYPLAVYNVSGEYSMVKAASMQGWIDEKSVVMETMTAFKRAGAHIIITYHALDVAKWLREE